MMLSRAARLYAFARGIRRSGRACCHAALLAAGLALLAPVEASAQRAQSADTEFTYDNAAPVWAPGSGPLVQFSEENSVFVQRGLAGPLRKLLEGDGFTTAPLAGGLTREALERGKIVVLVNAYRQDFADYPAMEPPSAYSDEEMAAVRQWVEDGGNLLILADHAPLGGGASQLAESFGFTFLNGHALEEKSARAGFVHVNFEFTPTNGLNIAHAITNGGMGRAPIERYFAFGGQAFIPPEDGTALLTFPSGWSAVFSYSIEAELASAPRIDADGMAQGAVATRGKGRVAVFGETGGFSAQATPNGTKFGFNAPEGKQNPEFILSVFRWLAGYRADE